METFSIHSEPVQNKTEAKKVLLAYTSVLESPCYVKLCTSQGIRKYYVEKCNVGSGWLVIESEHVGIG